MRGFPAHGGEVLAPQRLRALCRLGRLPRGLFYPPERRARRWAMMLRAWDGEMAGASRRQVAAAIFGETAAHELWESGCRSRMQRLVREAEVMVSGGYLRLLGRPAPEREDFDPMAMPRSLLPFLIIWNVSEEDFHVRLAGTEVCQAAGGELRGKALSRTREIDGDHVLQEFDAVAGGTLYSYVERTMAWTRNEHLLCQHLLLPLSVSTRISYTCYRLMNLS